MALEQLSGWRNELANTISASYPRNVVRGSGEYVYDQAGTAYLDLWMGYGALMFGHADERLAAELRNGLRDGWFFSYPTAFEKELSTLLHQIIPCAERVRYAVSGSDAVAYAVRAARAHTGRSHVLSIEGGYHGVHENMVWSVGANAKHGPTKVRFNDAAAIGRELQNRDYACLVMEPVLANSGCVPPTSGYLESVQQACRDTGTVLIFDEVVTGFRVSIGGAQQRYGVTPDMATFSKAIAGGLPLSVVAGRRELLDQSIPRGEVFFAGTFNGSPLSLVGARHILARLGDSQIYDDLSAMRSRLTGAIQEHSNALGLRVAVQGTGSMPSIAFDCDSFPSVVAAGANKERYTRLASYLAERERILLPPLYTETIFLSTAHLAHERDLLGGANARFGLVGKRCRFLKREAARVYPSRRKCRLSPFARGARKSRRRRQSNAAKEQ